MTKPTLLPVWDSNGTHLVAITAGHQTDGLANGEIPGSGERNTLDKNFADWITYLQASRASQRTRLPAPFLNTSNMALGSWSISGNPSPGYIVSGSAPSGEFFLDLELPVGSRLTSLNLEVNTATLNAFVFNIQAFKMDATVGAVFIGTVAGNAGFHVAGAGIGTVAPLSLNFVPDTAVQTLTMTTSSAGNGVITRGAGSFITDGFFLGQEVQLTGFANSVNNYAGDTTFGGTGYITALAANSMTVHGFGSGTTITETSTTAEIVGLMPAGDGTFLLALSVTGSGSSATGTHAVSFITYGLAPTI